MSEPSILPLQEPIAIVGLGSIFPGSDTPEGFWRDIVEARDRMSDVPPTHWLIEDYYDPDPRKPDMTYCRRGAFISPVEFDPLEFGIPPNTLEATDSAQLISLIVARNVLADYSCGKPFKIDRERTSVILGFSGAMELVSTMAARMQRPVWRKSLLEKGVDHSLVEAICDRIEQHFTPWQEGTFPGLLDNVVAGRIANRLDLHGSNLTTDAACASALSAIHSAVNQLLLRESDLVIAGGVDSGNDIFAYMCFSKTPALSPTEDCRPFSDKADGTILGEGIGMIAFRRLADAERDGDRIYAVLRGIGFASDGRSKSIYAPRSDGQARALRRAYERAGYSPRTVELLEAHGTGTRAGDAAEVEGLRSVFGEAMEAGTEPARNWCALGSVKSQIGHTKAAAGAAGMMKAAMALHQKVLPPTIKVDRPDPELRLAGSPFYINNAARPWIRGSSHPRRASVSSFGFGGTNFHAALEEYIPVNGTPAATGLRTCKDELFLYSGDNSKALADLCRELSRAQGSISGRALASQQAFDAKARVRVAIVAGSQEDLTARLREAESALRESETPSLSSPAGLYIASGDGIGGDTAFLFPGQGSQYVAMGAELAMAHGSVRRVWDSLADVRFDGLAVHDVTFPPPVFDDESRAKLDARLRATEWAQPALGLAGIAAFGLVSQLGLNPRCYIGHSFGELTALCASGCFSAGDLIRLARARGELMRDAAGEVSGGMIALAMQAADAAALLERSGSDAVLANLNAPDETVVSGSLEALALVEKQCASEGIAAKKLPVATAFHSPLVAPAAAAFSGVLETVAMAAPSVAVSSNIDAELYPADAAEIRRRLSVQLSGAVHFADQIGAAWNSGVRVFVELGPGSVLSDLTRRILKGQPHLAVSIDRRSRDGVTSLHHALAQLAVAGVALKLEALWEGHEPPAVKTDRRDSTVTLTGTNYGKPYPPGPKEKIMAPKTTPKPPAAVTQKLGADVTQTHAAPVPPNPAPHAPQVSQPVPVGAPGSALLEAYQDIQRRTAETHAAVSRAMADSHAAFLATMEASFADLAALMSGQPIRPHATRSAPPTAWTPPPAMTAPAPVAWTPPPAAAPAPAPAVAAVPLPRPAPQPEPEPELPPTDLAALLLTIVAEKTGYRADMLGIDMELEADLGIDSIKRVEILSAMRDAVPSLPEVRPADMAGIRTLGDVVRLLGQNGLTPVSGARAQSDTPSEADSEGDRSAPTVALERLVARLEAASAPGLALSGLRHKGRLVVTRDGGGIAEALVGVLGENGIAAELVREVPSDASAVIFLGGLRKIQSPEDAFAVNREAFRSARTLAARSASAPGVFVGVQDTGGDFGLSGRDALRAWLGGIAGLVRTVEKELPGVSVKAIDCEIGNRSATDVAQAIVRELLSGGDTRDVALRADGERFTVRMAPAVLPGGALPLQPGAVVIASGGGRGVTSACLIELARRCHPYFVLLGRTELVEEPGVCAGAVTPQDLTRVLLEDARQSGRHTSPSAINAEVRAITSSREVRETLAALEREGSKAVYLPVDVQDADAVRSVFDDVRARFGPVRGLIHGAGVLADKRLAEKTDAQFDRVFDTKVKGLLALLEAAKDDDLRWICLFSSFVARAGNEGQSDYAMANEILNLAASAERARRGDACVVRSIGWGPWEGGMVSPALQKHFLAMGIPLIPLAAGARAFVAEGAASGDVVVGLGVGSAAAAGSDAQFEVWVDDRTCPYLKDHAVNGAPVVPVALVTEWFLRAMSEVRPGVAPAIRSLKVIRGIRLAPGLPGELFRITRRFSEGAWRLELHSSGAQRGPKTLCYSAVADFAVAADEPAVKIEAPGEPVTDRIYDGIVLFHGPAFQVLRTLEKSNGPGMSADLVGLSELGWQPDFWQTDPAALDGMLQVCARLAETLLGGAVLPMSYGSLHLLRTGPATTKLRTTAKAIQQRSSSVVFDIAMANATGDPFAVLSGAEFVLRPHVVNAG